MSRKRLIQCFAICLIGITLVSCESNLCKAAKVDEAEASLQQMKASTDYESIKQNKKRIMEVMKQGFVTQGFSDLAKTFDYEKDYQIAKSKQLSALVQANSDKSMASSLRIKACSQ